MRTSLIFLQVKKGGVAHTQREASGLHLMDVDFGRLSWTM